MKQLSTILLILCAQFSIAQFELDNEINLTGSTVSDRQVSNLGPAYDTTNIVSALDIQSNRLIYCSAIGNDSILVNTQVSYNAYLPGSVLLVRIDSNNAASPVINVNGLGYKTILKNYADSLQSNDLIKGQLVYLIYDGANFQLINWLENFCPSGFTKVNNSYCIEADENNASNLWDAIINCKSKNAKMCTWAEWYYACQKTGLGLLNMTNNFEWLNCPINNPNQALIIGNGDCLTGTASHATTTSYNFRCCYAK